MAAQYHTMPPQDVQRLSQEIETNSQMQEDPNHVEEGEAGQTLPLRPHAATAGGTGNDRRSRGTGSKPVPQAWRMARITDRQGNSVDPSASSVKSPTIVVGSRSEKR